MFEGILFLGCLVLFIYLSNKALKTDLEKDE